jgi:DNA primase
MANPVKFDKLDFEKILATYNVRNLKTSGEWIIFSCPFPEHERGDQRPSSAINIESGGYNCLGCKRSGTIIDFVADYEGITLVQAVEKLRESEKGVYGAESLVTELEERIKPKEVTPPKTTKISEIALQLFEVDWHKAYEAYEGDGIPYRIAYPFFRHLKPETLQQFDIGYDKNSKRITIPFRDIEGNLVGFKGRATDPTQQPKYLSIGDKEKSFYGFPTVKTSNYVWGLDSATSDLIIVEGEFDAISLRQRGFSGSVAISGSNFSYRQFKFICRKASSINILFDPDDAGRRAERKWSREFEKYFPTKIAHLKEKDPSESTTDEIKEALEKATSSLLSV